MSSDAASRQPGTPRRRDRRGRGRRGPDVLPGPLSPRGVPASRSRRERFDEIVVAVARELQGRWSSHLGAVEFAVEETPWLPEDWTADAIPLAALAPATATAPTRVVVFRRPIELRASGSTDLAALVHAVMVEQVAEMLGLPVDEIDPRYED